VPISVSVSEACSVWRRLVWMAKVAEGLQVLNPWILVSDIPTHVICKFTPALSPAIS